MNRKPPILAELQYDRALAAVPHIVESFNWLINYVANLKGKDGINIEDSDTDHPTISINIEGQDGITVEKTEDGITIKGGSGGGGVKSVNEAVGDVKFVSADDSNLTFTKDGDDKIIVGCYYV